MTDPCKSYFRTLFSSVYFLLVIFPLVVSAAQVSLEWDPNGEKPDGYNLFHRFGDHSYDYDNPTNSALITATTYTVKGLDEGRTYYFIVRAVAGSDESANSNEVVHTVPVSLPDADNDGHHDGVDAFPHDKSEWRDTDGDGIGNHADTDDDGDGMPDAWEEKYGLDPLDSTDAKGDLDGDGISNRDENIHGSDPSTVPGNASPLQPKLIAPLDGDVDVDLMPTLVMSDYGDPEGHAHARTQFQIATSTDWENDLVFACSLKKQLTYITLGDLILDAETTYFWRVRYFDAHNAPSAWAAPSSFTTAGNEDAGFVDDDGNGVLDEQEVSEEDVAPELGDTSDAIVLGTKDETNPQLSVRLSSDADIVTIRSAEADNVEVGSIANRPEKLTGLISFKIALLNGETTADVTVNLTTPAPENAVWYKYNTEEGWVPYDNVIFADDRKSVTIHLVDGGPGDDDGVENGVIVDPSGLGYNYSGSSLSNDTPSATGSAGSGGCFIASSLNAKTAENRQPTPIMIWGLVGIGGMLLFAGYRK